MLRQQSTIDSFDGGPDLPTVTDEVRDIIAFKVTDKPTSGCVPGSFQQFFFLDDPVGHLGSTWRALVEFSGKRKTPRWPTVRRLSVGFADRSMPSERGGVHCYLCVHVLKL